MNRKQIKALLFNMRTFFTRNQYDIHNHPAKKNCVNVEYSFNYNIGDTLSPIIVNYMLEKKGINPDKTVSKTKHLLAIGSTMSRGMCDITVWGSGFLRKRNMDTIGKKYKYLGVKYDIRAVRGPRTRDVLLERGIACPEVYGDPAILMPFIYQPTKTEKKYPVSLILHHRTTVTTTEETNEEAYIMKVPENIHIISPETDDYKTFIDELVASEVIISSSLHGIILAETYGTPCVFLNWGMKDQNTKFHDWYESTGREYHCVHTLEEALKSQSMPLPDLETVKQNIMNAFPYDLWECE